MRNVRYLLLGAMFLCLLVACSSPKKQTDAAEVHYILGISYLKEQDPTRALKQFLLAAEKNPRRADIQGALAQSYHLKKAYEDAERHYLRAIDLSNNDPQYQNNLAALYLDMKRWDDAIAYFRKAASNLLFNDSEVAFTGVGFAYFQKGEFLDAVIAYKEALARNPRFAQAHFRLGEAYYALEKTHLAIDAFRQALSQAPNFSLAHYKLGLSYMKERQTEKARASFEKVVDLDPDSEWAGLSRDYLQLLK